MPGRSHYIKLPYKPPCQPAWVKIAAPDPENIVEAYERYVRIVRESAKPEERAVALCWIFHLTGTYISRCTQFPCSPSSSGFPMGIEVARVSTSSPRHRARPYPCTLTGMAWYWGLNATTWSGNEAGKLRNAVGLTRADLSELSAIAFSPTAVDAWARKESLEIAKVLGYLDGKLKGGKSKANAVTLPQGYSSHAKGVAERRMVLSGYRLADVLTQLVGPQ